MLPLHHDPVLIVGMRFQRSGNMSVSGVVLLLSVAREGVEPSFPPYQSGVFNRWTTRLTSRKRADVGICLFGIRITRSNSVELWSVGLLEDVINPSLQYSITPRRSRSVLWERSRVSNSTRIVCEYPVGESNPCLRIESPLSWAAGRTGQ